MALKSVRKTVKQAARMGKGRDNTLAHLASGEVVIPLDFQKKFPAVGAALRQSFEKAGLDYDQFVVGSPKNRINPRTGAPMFDDGGGGGDGGGGDGGGGDGGGGDGGDGGGGDAGGGDAGGGDAGGGDAGGGAAGGDAGGGAAGGEGAGADEGGGGFGGYGGGFGGYGDSGDAAGYSGEAGAAMGDAAAGAGYGSTGSTGDEGSAGAAGDQGGGLAGGPSAGEMGGDPEPDIPAGDPMEYISPGQTTFNALMDGLLGSVLSGTLTQDPTAEDVRGGFTGTSSPALSGPQAEAIAREDAMNAVREDVARNEEAAAALMNANQAAQEAAAAQAAAASSNINSGGLLSGQSIFDNSMGLTAPSPGLSDIYGGPVYSTGTTTNQDTTSFPEGDLAGTTGNLGMGSSQDQSGQQDDSGTGLSALDVTEIGPAPSIFDLTQTENLPGIVREDEGSYVGIGDGGGDTLPRLTEEELLALENQQQAAVAPTVRSVPPIQYDISKFISGIGSLATSR